MNKPQIFADFQNSDAWGRIRLNTIGSIEDLNRSRIVLRPGMPLLLYCDEIEADGEAVYSQDEGIWAATIDWDKVRKRKRS